MTIDNLGVKVLRKNAEALDIASFELASADGKPLPPFSAGSHIGVQVPGGITRQYSLCNDDKESHRYPHRRVARPATRGGSAGMHDKGEGGRRAFTIQLVSLGYR